MSSSSPDELMREAERVLGKWFGGAAKKEEAAGIYNRAGNLYKTAKRWDEAAEAFIKAAELFAAIREDNDAVTAFTEAARSYRKSTHHDRAVSIFQDKVIPGMLEAGRHGQAAKLYEEIAEMHQEDGEIGGAMTAFSQAADLYISDNQKAAASKCQVKLALMAGTESNYDLAIDTFEMVAAACLENNLLKFNAKGHLLCSALCVLAKGDLVLSERKIAEYKEMDYTFGDSRECKLVEDVARAFADLNVDAFTDTVYEFDRISKLDPWKTTILLRIKTQIATAASGVVDVT